MRVRFLDYVIGDSSRLPFDVLLSLRSQFVARPFPTALAIIAVAASVALAASVEVASRSVSAALEKSMNAVAGSTQLEVTAAGQGVFEDFIEVVRNVPGVRSASPIIPETVRLLRPDGEQEALRIIGIDLLYDREVRDYGIAEQGFRVRDHLRLVASGDSIILSEDLAERLGVEEGGELTLRAANGFHTVTVRGVLLGDLASAYGGSLAVMDVFALQKLLGMGPRVSRIDVAVIDGELLETVRSGIERAVGDAVRVRPSTIRANIVTPILAAYRFGVWAITLIGVLLSLFLTYAAISIVVDRRIVEFALLRTAGMDATRASRAVVVDALVLAWIGTLLGLALALAFAARLVVFFSRASKFYQDLAVEPAAVSGVTIAVAVAVGVPMALLACIEPAMRTGRRGPLDVVSGGGPFSQKIPTRNGRLIGLGVFSLAAYGIAAVSEEISPGPRLGLVVAFSVIAIWALSSALLPAGLPAFQTMLAGVVPRVGVLVGASIGDRPVETGVTVAIWAAVVAATFSLLTGLSSLGISMDEFISGEAGPGAIMAFGEDPGSTSPSERLPIDPDVVSAIERTPGVTAAWASRSTMIMFREEEVQLDDYDVERLVRNGGLQSVSDDPESSIEALRRGELLASNAFLAKFGVEIGDTIEITTADGLKLFRVGGRARSFAGPSGKLYLESGQFSRWFWSRGANNVVFWVDGPLDETLAGVRRAVGSTALFFREGEAFRRQARRVIERFSSLLTVPLMVVASIGLIGLANLLVGNVAARSRDLALIRASGGTSWNILAIVGLSAAVVALSGTVAGLLLGLSWAIVIRDAITHFLGWRMSLTVEWKLIGELLAGALAAASVAAMTSAVVTIRRDGRSDVTG